MRDNRTTWRLLLLMALTALAATGCIFSPDETTEKDPGDTSDYVWPSDASKLMQNFQTAYTKMDIDAYELLLSEQHFKFFFLQGEYEAAFWGYESDVASTRNLFSGNPPPNPEPGITNRGIQSIEVDELVESEAWVDVSAAHPWYGDVEGAERAVYDVRFILHHDDGTITVTNQQIFYAAPFQVDVDGTMKTRWRIIGQEEQPGA